MKYLVLFVFLSFCASCTKVYRADYSSRTLANHRTIAILPPLVDFTDRKSPLEDQAGELAAAFQGGMYDWLQYRRGDTSYEFTIQDPDATNDRLEAAGFYEGEDFGWRDLATVLEVDALIISTCSFRIKSLNGVALQTGGFPVSFATNRLYGDIRLFDADSGRMIWEHTPRVMGGSDDSPLALLDRLAQRTTKYLPYFR